MKILSPILLRRRSLAGDRGVLHDAGAFLLSHAELLPLRLFVSGRLAVLQNNKCPFFSTFPIRSSRACLGKWIIYIYQNKWRKKAFSHLLGILLEQVDHVVH
jgi:hypothetical protein